MKIYEVASEGVNNAVFASSCVRSVIVMANTAEEAVALAIEKHGDEFVRGEKRVSLICDTSCPQIVWVSMD